MIVKRNISVNVDKCRLGDTIEFTLTDGQKVRATARKKKSNGLLFVMEDCLRKPYPMFKNIDRAESLSYLNSDLRIYLNTEVLIHLFPEEIKRHMVGMKMADGRYDLLRIPTEKEIFGENEYGEEEPEKVKRFMGMEYYKNRIAYRDGEWDWYWLQNNSKDYAAFFALVADSGFASNDSASYSLGVRPVFLLS